MPTQEDITQQQNLLRIHRRNLTHYLRQSAQHGPGGAPVSVMNGILDTQSEIQRIKAILRGWGVAVDDLPDDGGQPAPTSQPASPPSKASEMRRNTLQRRIKALSEEHDAVERQLNNVLDPGSQVRLMRQLQDLEDQIAQLEEGLQNLA